MFKSERNLQVKCIIIFMDVYKDKEKRTYFITL